MDCNAYRDQMLDVLYGEASDAARRAVDAHHASCEACRDELSALRRLRRELSSWQVPAPALPARRTLRVWPGLAAAAAVLMAAGAAVAVRGAELRRDASGWSLRVGSEAADLRARLDELDARHRAELAELRASLASAPAERTDEAVLAAARELVERSEERQQARLEDALSRLSDRYEAQRRYDLAQMSAGLSYLEGKSSQHAARTTELVGQVLLASQEK
jgi:hypothetical protein